MSAETHGDADTRELIARAHEEGFLAGHEQGLADGIERGLREAADEMGRLDAIGKTRRDLISDADWEWFCDHPLTGSTTHVSLAIPPVREWLALLAEHRDERGVA